MKRSRLTLSQEVRCRFGLLLVLLCVPALAALAQPNLDSTLVPWVGYTPSVLDHVLFLLKCGALFLLPGAAIVSLLFRQPEPYRLRFVAITILCSALAGYAFFWVYLWSPHAGRWASWVVPPLAAAILALRVVQVWRTNRPAVIELRNWMVAVFLVAGFYTSLTFLYHFAANPLGQAQLRWLPGHLPPDNVLPYMLASRMFRGEPVRPFLFADWNSSDRPPLQTALTLAQMPWWGPELRQSFQYESLAVFLQCLWVAGLGILLRRSGLSRRTCALVLTFSITSGFFLVHSTFVWPKLLAASLTMLGLSFTPLVRVERSDWRRPDIMWATTAFALALLSHGGAMFTLLGAGTVCLLSRRLPRLRALIPAAVIGLLLLLPWQMYQRFYDPPGNRLLKWHLAGQSERSALSLAEALKQSYGKLTLKSFVHGKLENVKRLLSTEENLKIFQGSLQSRLVFFLQGNFFGLSHALGLLNVGFLVRLARRRWARGAPLSGEERLADRLLLLAGTSILIWTLLMFNPGSTTLHQGSMADTALVFAALVVYIVNCRSRIAFAALAAGHTALFVLFIFAKPIIHKIDLGGTPFPLRQPMAASALLFAAAALLWGWQYVTAAEPAPAAAKGAARSRRRKPVAD